MMMIHSKALHGQFFYYAFYHSLLNEVLELCYTEHFLPERQLFWMNKLIGWPFNSLKFSPHICLLSSAQKSLFKLNQGVPSLNWLFYDKLPLFLSELTFWILTRLSAWFLHATRWNKDETSTFWWTLHTQHSGPIPSIREKYLFYALWPWHLLIIISV